MEFQKLIESRRSIRKYDGSKKVTKEQIETLIAAATEAPSWKTLKLQGITVFSATR